MIKLIALYTQPQDAAAFDAHIFSEHVRLMKQLPHLLRYEIGKIIGSTIGDTRYYLICDMYFDDEQKMNQAMASPEGRRFAKDIMCFAPDILSMMYAEVAG